MMRTRVLTMLLLAPVSTVSPGRISLSATSLRPAPAAVST